MFDNLFLIPHFEGSPPETPSRLYMRLDQVEGRWALFDAVGADFFDGLGGIEGVAGWAAVSSKAPVFVLQSDLERWPWPPMQPPPDWEAFEEFDDLQVWLEAVLAPGGEDQLYFNLFREAQPVTLIAVSLVSDARAARLAAAFDLSPLQRTPEEIQSVLDRISGSIEWVGVYDVGQGNANGLCDSTETPLVYFDLGGGVNGNVGTFPSALTDFCYQASPPVVLSHWDWDHWSSGAKFARAQALDWIVPVQHLGGVHSTFAAGLHKAGKLYVWPSTLTSRSSGQVTVRKCTGAGGGRNHTGLAVEVKGPAGEAPILLTGDARYTAIPGATGASFTSVVAPHHGADMRSRATPAGRSLSGARTAYSFGFGNTWTHPHAVTLQHHDRAGWPHRAYGAPVPVDRDTTARGGAGLGHLGLGWTATPTLPGHACTSPNCSVGLVNT